MGRRRLRLPPVLKESLNFPDPRRAGPNGLVALGGDLSAGRLVRAYRSGIFPWTDDPIPRWYSPDPRMILQPEAFRLSRKAAALERKRPFEIKANTDFIGVMRGCATMRRKHEFGTWISPTFLEAYTELHRRGYAHSIEAWKDGRLVGGIYGLHLGACFFGESMFHTEDNASKFALAALMRRGLAAGWLFLDAQIPSAHIHSHGGIHVSRLTYLSLLREGLSRPTDWDLWNHPLSDEREA